MAIFFYVYQTTSTFGQRIPSFTQYGPAVVFEDIPSVLFFIGEIRDNDYFEIRRAIRRESIDTVALSSPGGSVWEGLMIAGLVSDLSIGTYVPEGGLCASACSYIFFAGNTRIIDGELGVHQFYHRSGDSPTNPRTTQFTISEILGFLNEFGTPPFVYELMFQREEMYFFPEEEALSLERYTGAQLSNQARESISDRLLDFYDFLENSVQSDNPQQAADMVPSQEITPPAPASPAPTPPVELESPPADFRFASECVSRLNAALSENNITFQSQRVALSLDETNGITMRRIVNVLERCQRWVFEIAVHAFDSQDPTINLSLSISRALSLRNRFLGMGIPSRNITARGYGDTQPIFFSTPQDRVRNTRIAIRYIRELAIPEQQETRVATPPTQTGPLPTRPVPRPQTITIRGAVGVTGLTQDQLTFLRLQISSRSGNLEMLDYQEVTDPFYFRGAEAAFLNERLSLNNALRITSSQNALSIFSNGYLPPNFTERRYPELLQDSQSFNSWEAYLHEDLCGIRTRSISTTSNLLQFVPELHLIHFRQNGGATLNWYLPFPPILALEQGASVSIDGRQVAVEVGEISIEPVQLENAASTSLTRAMRNGMQMSVSGINRLNNQPVTIEFSLNGFTQSFYQMMSDCDAQNLGVWIR